MNKIEIAKYVKIFIHVKIFIVYFCIVKIVYGNWNIV